MVFFTCNTCGESVKKNKVEAHSFKCSRKISVSCMDCNKDFNGMTYHEHTECITEKEKYSAKGFVPRQPLGKGKAKQQAWLSTVNALIASRPNLPKEDKQLLTSISKYENIPRKKNKFENFLMNGIFKGSQECIDRVWTIIQEKFTEMKQNNESVASSASENKGSIEKVEHTPPKQVNGVEDKASPKLKKKALKKQGESSVSEEEVVNASPKRVSGAEQNAEIQSPKLSKKQRKALMRQTELKESLKVTENPPAAVDTTIEMDSSFEKMNKGKKRKAEVSFAPIELNQKETEAKGPSGASLSLASKGEKSVVDAEKQVNGTDQAQSPKLSKKQRKALMRKAQTEKSLQNTQDTPAAGNTTNEMDSSFEKTKKGKKRKAEVSFAHTELNHEEIEADDLNGVGSPSPKKKSKKPDAGFIVDTAGNSSVKSVPSPNKPDKFDWQDRIVKTLVSANKSLSMKILRKKVLAQYVAETGQPITDTTKSKFNKRVASAPGVKVLKSNVVLS